METFFKNSIKRQNNFNESFCQFKLYISINYNRDKSTPFKKYSDVNVSLFHFTL